MSGIEHQTVRLSTGSHSVPAEGACVMELASMLAGEPFTDAPDSVCPVIRDFLRSYNDRIDDEGRQALYACAAAVVGSRSTPCVEHERLRLCAEARAPACGGGGRRSRRFPPSPWRDTPPSERVGSSPRAETRTLGAPSPS